MNNFKNVKVEKQNNVNVYYCLDCGAKLTRDEYNSCHDRCKKCQANFYNRKINGYIDLDGNNKIDVVLTNKAKRR